MLPKSRRLSVRDIESLTSGKSVFGTLFSIRYTRAPLSKFAVSVSKKVAPKAVDRNRMRRRTYTALRPLLTGIQPGFAMFMPKKEALGASEGELQSDIVSLLKKAGLL